MVKSLIFLVFCLTFALAAYRPTPVGWMEERCIHKVLKHGDHIHESDSGKVVITNDFDSTRRLTLSPAGCKPIFRRRDLNQTSNSKQVGDYDGWLAYTTSQNTAGSYDSFLGYFSIPDAPQSAPEVLYLFTGLQNVDWIPIVDPEPPVFDIIQPVLQYPGDGGNYWSVKSWYVTLDAGYLVSDEVQVNSGNQIFGNMTQTGPSTWYIGSVDVSSGQVTYLSVTRNRLASQPWAYNTAECYGCDAYGCSSLPDNSVQFTKLYLTQGGKQVTPSWVTHTTPNPICSEQAHVQDPTSVSITFQQQ